MYIVKLIVKGCLQNSTLPNELEIDEKNDSYCAKKK